MKTDLEQRLARRFDRALADAGRDYPTLGIGRAGTPRRHASASSQPRRLAAMVAGVGVVAVLLAGGIAIVARPAEILGPAAGETRATITLPPKIDDQRVFTIAEIGRRADTEGSFLLRAYAQDLPVPCAPPMGTPSTTAERDLVPECGTISLVPAPSNNTTIYFNLAPRTRDLLRPWLNGPEIVIRAHTHDQEAASCGADFLSQCEAALVVEAVVWPLAPAGTSTPTTPASAAGPQELIGPDGVPTSLNGMPVHRAVDLQQGDFWLGGRLERTTACAFPTEQSLRCGYTVDGVPLGSRIEIPSDLVGSIVVVEVVRAMPALSCPPGPCPGKEPIVTIQAIVWAVPGSRASAAASN